MASPFVLDASVALCWAFHDETDSRATAAADLLANAWAHVPALFWYEVRNGIVISERKGRLSPTAAAAYLSDQSLLAIRYEWDEPRDGAVSLARKHRLSVYDAAYLDLAVRLALPLATLDRDLATAARAEHITLVGEP